VDKGKGRRVTNVEQKIGDKEGWLHPVGVQLGGNQSFLGATKVTKKKEADTTSRQGGGVDVESAIMIGCRKRDKG